MNDQRTQPSACSWTRQSSRHRLASRPRILANSATDFSPHPAPRSALRVAIALLVLLPTSLLAHGDHAALPAKAKVRQAKAQFEIAKRKLRSVGLTAMAIERILEGDPEAHWLSIASPIQGDVSAADVRVGQAVEPLDHLFHVVNRSTVMIV